MQEAVLRVRLYKDIDLHNELLNKINSLPRSYKAEYLRNCLLLGDSVLRGRSPLPASQPFPVPQPPAQPTAAPTLHMDVPQKPQQTAAPDPAQEVDQSPASFSPDHQEDEALHPNVSTKSDDDTDDIDPLDPLAKMKNKFKGA